MYWLDYDQVQWVKSDPAQYLHDFICKMRLHFSTEVH